MNQATITLDQFRALMLAAGYDEVVERKWEPSTMADTHTHPFEANAIVVQGEMLLTVNGQAPRKLLPGDTFHLHANTPHAEAYSAAGTTYWVARKNVGAAPKA
jgi:hypothetical protein